VTSALPSTGGVVTGASTFNSNLSVGGNLIVSGSVALGDSGSDALVINAAPSIGGAGLGMGMGFRNRIINGAMVIDQRNAGASVTPTNAQYSVDRWKCLLSQSSKYTVQQNAGSVTPPAGFTKYLGATSSSSYSVVTGDYFTLYQIIEGLNVTDLAWGTASAVPVTLSFWVYSSLTGTLGGSVVATGGSNYSYPFTFTVSSANTWEYKTISVPANTFNTINTDTNGAVQVAFNLGAGATFSGTANTWQSGYFLAPTGATSVVGTNGATFYVTGVQLEKGSVATAFDYRSYTTELQLCQRYAIVYGRDQNYNEIGGTGFAYSTTKTNIPVSMPVQMRSTPTIANSGNLQASDGAAATALTAISIITQQSSSLIASLEGTAASGLTAYRPYRIETNNSTTAYVLLSAEL
jgi:hypothetical protein